MQIIPAAFAGHVEDFAADIESGRKLALQIFVKITGENTAADHLRLRNGSQSDHLYSEIGESIDKGDLFCRRIPFYGLRDGLMQDTVRLAVRAKKRKRGAASVILSEKKEPFR